MGFVQSAFFVILASLPFLRKPSAPNSTTSATAVPVALVARGSILAYIDLTLNLTQKMRDTFSVPRIF